MYIYICVCVCVCVYVNVYIARLLVQNEADVNVKACSI